MLSNAVFFLINIFIKRNYGKDYNVIKFSIHVYLTIILYQVKHFKQQSHMFQNGGHTNTFLRAIFGTIK